MNTVQKFFILLISITYLTTIVAQPTMKWEKRYGGSTHDKMGDIQQTSDGGYIVAAYSRSSDIDVSGNNGDWDASILKLNTAGVLQWEVHYGGINQDRMLSIQQTSDGGYVAAGFSYSDNGDVIGNNGQEDYWIIKLSETGDLQWQKNYGGTGEDRAMQIRQTTDGGYVVVGYSGSDNGDVSNNKGELDYWILKLDEEGNLDWEKNYGGSSVDLAFAIEQTTDGGYIVSGHTFSTDGDVSGNKGNFDYWVIKLDASGNLDWGKTYGGTASDRSQAIQPTTDGGYIVSGYSESSDGDVSNNRGQADYWIIKINENGNLQWQKNYGGSKIDKAYTVQQTSDGGYLIGGESESSNGEVSGNQGLSDYWLIKLKSSGSLEWQQHYGGTDLDEVIAARQTTDDGYIVAGHSRSDDGDLDGNYGGWDYWIFKLSPLPTSVVSIDNSPSVTLQPNPSDGNFTIQLPKSTSLVLIQIFDVSGKLVDTDHTDLEQITINHLPKGLYWVNISNDDFNISKKIIVE